MKVPLGAITVSCSTHEWACVNGVKAKSHNTVRLADMSGGFRILERQKRLVVGDTNCSPARVVKSVWFEIMFG